MVIPPERDPDGSRRAFHRSAKQAWANTVRAGLTSTPRPTTNPPLTPERRAFHQVTISAWLGTLDAQLRTDFKYGQPHAPSPSFGCGGSSQGGPVVDKVGGPGRQEAARSHPLPAPAEPFTEAPTLGAIPPGPLAPGLGPLTERPSLADVPFEPLSPQGDCDRRSLRAIWPPEMVDSATRRCFAWEYGKADWPVTDCCPPDNMRTRPCTPPSKTEAEAMFARLIDGSGWNPALADHATPSRADEQLLGAALVILFANFDLAVWAACLVKAWSPEMFGVNLVPSLERLMTLDGSGLLPFGVTWVTSLGLASMAAFTRSIPEEERERLGLVVPIEPDWWTEKSARFAGTDSEDAFCAALQVAGTVLHELIHIIGDDRGAVSAGPPVIGILFGTVTNERGANHEDKSLANPCWDEPRMVATIFRWAVSQRYPCLASSANCSEYGEDWLFAHSSVNPL